MRIAVFFVFFCFLLLKGYSHIHHNLVGRSPVQNIKKTSQILFTKASQDYKVIKNINIGNREADLICDDVEDEETNSSFVRKYTSLARCYLTLSYLFILRYLYHRFRACATFCSLLPYKYITQGVLRI